MPGVWPGVWQQLLQSLAVPFCSHAHNMQNTIMSVMVQPGQGAGIQYSMQLEQHWAGGMGDVPCWQGPPEEPAGFCTRSSAAAATHTLSLQVSFHLHTLKV